MKPRIVWAAKWVSQNKLDGRREHIINGDDCLPVIFYTRWQARAWIETKYGFIRNDPSLRKEPHGWRMPTAVRVAVAEQ